MIESTPTQMRRRKPVFGIASLVCSCAAAGLAVYALRHCEDAILSMFLSVGFFPAPGTTISLDRIANFNNAVLGALGLWLVGLVLAIVAPVRAEWPRWLAIVGLLLCALPWAWMLLALTMTEVGVQGRKDIE